MDYVHILLLLLGMYECVTVPAYLRILYVLFRKSKFHLPFYRFITVIGILDLVHFAVDITFYRLPLLYPFNEWYSAFPASTWIGLVTFCIYFFTYQQFLLHVIISMNRLSAICFPLKHTMFWTRAWPWFVCSFAIVAICLSSDRLFTLAKFMPIAGDVAKGVVPFVTTYYWHQLDQSLITVFLGALCLAICLLANFSALYLVWRSKKSKSAAAQSEQQKRRLELNFLLVAVCMMVPQLVVSMFHFLLHSAMNGQTFGAFLNAGQNKTLIMYTMVRQMPWIDDLYSLSHPWILLCICSDLRKTVFQPFMNETKTKVISIKPITKSS